MLVSNVGITPAKNFRKKMTQSHNIFNRDFFEKNLLMNYLLLLCRIKNIE